MRMGAWIAGSAGLLFAVLIAPASAQEIGQPARGLASAERLCSECHAVRKEQARSPNPKAPRFEAVATTPGMTSIALSAALNTPHTSMPNVMLEPEERADIVAYILSLR
jgi:mono/diheme cytochrome c family protein